MAAPNAFTNELEQWVFQECIGSVVFVEFQKKSFRRVKTSWDRVVPIKGNDDEIKAAKEVRYGILRFGHFCTGFVVQDMVQEGVVKVLTCAHVLGDSFSKTKPITAQEVNYYFQPLIICDHHEHDRVPVQARVERIHLGRDLILLSLSRTAFHAYCPNAHVPIPMSPSYPEPLEKVVLLSWPPLNHRTAVSGTTTHPLRLYNNLSQSNPKGFTCRLAQVDISSEGGSSGAPLLNGAGQFLCTLHAGFGAQFSYCLFSGRERYFVNLGRAGGRWCR